MQPIRSSGRLRLGMGLVFLIAAETTNAGSLEPASGSPNHRVAHMARRWFGAGPDGHAAAWGE